MKQRTTLLSHALILLEIVYPYFAVFTFLLIVLESISYIGFIRQFVYLDSRYFLAVLLVWTLALRLLLLVQGKKAKARSELKIFTSANYLAMPLVFFSFYALVLMESSNYPNFVFSRYHIQLDNFRMLVIANTFVVLSDLFLRKTLFKLISSKTAYYYHEMDPTNPLEDESKRSNSFATLQNFKNSPLSFIQQLVRWQGRTLFSIWFILTLVLNIVNVSEIVISNSVYMIRKPFATYQEKMIRTWGEFYTFMQFVRDNTPDKSTIAIPPAQNHWLTTGNIVLVRYFLYPRTVVNLKETESANTLYRMPNVAVDYALLDKGSWADSSVSYGWPKIRLPVSAIILFHPDTLTTSTLKTQWYEPTQFENKDAWGILVLRK